MTPYPMKFGLLIIAEQADERSVYTRLKTNIPTDLIRPIEIRAVANNVVLVTGPSVIADGIKYLATLNDWTDVLQLTSDQLETLSP